MARITVEDCLGHVENRFDLVLFATRRARQLARGQEPLLPWENDKPTVMALREIAEGRLDKALMESIEQEMREKEHKQLLEQAFAQGFAADLGAEGRL